jgi:hypothetical protein
MRGFIRVLYVAVRNKLFIKPKAWPARRLVLSRLRELGWKVKAVEIWLGLGEPSQLALVVIFESDKGLKDFKEARLADELIEIFHARLLKSRYPTQAVPLTSITYHSQEEVNRVGWYEYFK